MENFGSIKAEVFDPTVNVSGAFRFQVGNQFDAVLVLDSDGFVYKGNRIDDAGEAYKAFMETMKWNSQT